MSKNDTVIRTAIKKKKKKKKKTERKKLALNFCEIIIFLKFIFPI